MIVDFEDDQVDAEAVQCRDHAAQFRQVILLPQGQFREFLSANNYAEITWATGVHAESGRPYESTLGNYDGQMRMISPSPLGGHNWQPMAFSPKTGLVYLPAHDTPFWYAKEGVFKVRPGTWNLGLDMDVVVERTETGRIPARAIARLHGLTPILFHLRVYALETDAPVCTADL